MRELPEGWEWATLGGIADTQLGKMLSKKSKTGVRSRPYLRNVNVQWHRIDLDDVPEMDFTEEESAKYELVPGDLLVCEGGEVGRTATWRGASREMHFQKALHRVRPLSGIDPKYIEYVMRWSADTRRFAQLVTGSTIAHLPQQGLRQVSIPVPPLPEQRRIVVTIEEHFSHLDAAEADLRAALARTTALMQATLIASIPCRDAPSDWTLTTVDAAGRTDLGRQRAPKYHDGPSMRPYLRVANVFEDRLDLSDVMEMNFDDESWSKYRLVDGDILLNEGQSPHLVGRPAIYRGDPESVAFTNSLIRFQAHDDVDPEWALLVFRRHLHARRFMREASITTNIAHLALKRFRTVEFPKPPLPEQRRLVAKVRSDLEAIPSS
jgi:type I restriction enzyme S subunit